MDLNGLIGELPRLFNSSDALKSSGETYRYLPVLELIRLSSLVKAILLNRCGYLRSDLRLFIQLWVWDFYLKQGPFIHATKEIRLPFLTGLTL